MFRSSKQTSVEPQLKTKKQECKVVEQQTNHKVGFRLYIENPPLLKEHRKQYLN